MAYLLTRSGRYGCPYHRGGTDRAPDGGGADDGAGVGGAGPGRGGARRGVLRGVDAPRRARRATRGGARVPGGGPGISASARRDYGALGCGRVGGGLPGPALG